MSSPTTEQTQNSTRISQTGTSASRPKMLLANKKFLNWSSISFAILQSALAAAAGIHAPARGFHQDAIRIPMMLLAFLGAVINLYVVWKVRRLRSRPASQWRQQPVTRKKLNSERFQIALSILTLLLLAAEWVTHPLVHRIP